MGFLPASELDYRGPTEFRAEPSAADVTMNVKPAFFMAGGFERSGQYLSSARSPQHCNLIRVAAFQFNGILFEVLRHDAKARE
jgi:hypothetical protein